MLRQAHVSLHSETILRETLNTSACMSVCLVFPMHCRSSCDVHRAVWLFGAGMVSTCRHNMGIQDLFGGHTHTSCLAGLSVRISTRAMPW